jgi:hypothetical protein
MQPRFVKGWLDFHPFWGFQGNIDKEEQSKEKPINRMKNRRGSIIPKSSGFKTNLFYVHLF